MSNAVNQIFDRALLARRRARHAHRAGDHDFLLRHAVEDLADRLAVVKRAFPVAASLGGAPLAGTMLRSRAGTERVIEADIAEVDVTRDGSAPPAETLVAADREAQLLASGSLDLIVSCLSLQLVNDLPGALIQIRRALKPDGLFLGALIGGRSLHELREAFVAAESEIEGGASPRVAPFADVRDLGALMQRAGFALPVADSDTLEVGYADAFALMRDLKGMGWSNMLADRRRSFLKRRTLFRAAEFYAERFSRPDGRVRATFEIVTLTGWAPDESQQKPLRPGSAKSRLADALGTSEQKLVQKSGESDA